MESLAVTLPDVTNVAKSAVLETSYVSSTGALPDCGCACVHRITLSAKGSPLATPKLNATGLGAGEGVGAGSSDPPQADSTEPVANTAETELMRIKNSLRELDVGVFMAVATV